MDDILSALFKDHTRGNDADIRAEVFEFWTAETGLSRGQLLDALALALAIGFASQEQTFDFCYAAMARLQTSTFPDWPPLFWEIYIAFDAGTFVHGQDMTVDPIESHARPMIETIIRRCGGPDSLWPDAVPVGS